MRTYKQKHHIIYKTTCNVTGRYYLGMHSTNNLDDGYPGSGDVISRSIEKHGREKHSTKILETLPDRKSLIEREKQLITTEVLKDPLCMNLKLGGEGGWEDVNPWPPTRARKLSLERRLQIGKSQEGKVKSQETRNKISKSNLGKHHIVHTEETKRKIREGNLKMKGENNGFFGKKHSDESIAKFKNRAYVHNGEIYTCIKKDQIDDYLSNGWIRGKCGKFKRQAAA